jgi:GT2 family glycosyltransferase
MVTRLPPAAEGTNVTVTSNKAPTGLFVEVLICTHNRSALLQRTLEFLNQATRPVGVHLEILVVTNACTDDTENDLDGYMSAAVDDDKIPLRWMRVPIPGKSNALNRAIPELRGEVIAFVDDDHRVDDRYLVEICAAVTTHPDVGLFCGRILPDWDGSEPAWVHHQGPYKIYPLPVPRFDQGDKSLLIAPGTVTPGGGNLFLRREVFARVGDFAVDLGPVGHDLGGAEDIEWVRRALRKGEALRYAPGVVQYHYVELERLQIAYVMRKAYERTVSTMRLNLTIGEMQRLPLYMWRKLFAYAFQGLTSMTTESRRYYLVRIAAAWGEIRGFQKRRIEAKAGIRRGA